MCISKLWLVEMFLSHLSYVFVVEVINVTAIPPDT